MSLLKSNLKYLYALSISAALLYDSWPIGRLLNPTVSRKSLASGLEAVGQPYNWLFIGGDIVSSLFVITFSLLILQKLKDKKQYQYINISLICAIIFGLGTIVDALLPLRCIQEIQNCPSFTVDHQLLAHGIFSILASVFLFISMVILWYYKRQSTLLSIFLFGYIVFGVVSLVEAIIPGTNGNWSQDYYITLCSIWIALIPFIIYEIVDEKGPI